MLKFRTINNKIRSPLLTWYVKSVNEIDVIEMDPKTMSYNHQIQFHVKIHFVFELPLVVCTSVSEVVIYTNVSFSSGILQLRKF